MVKSVDLLGYVETSALTAGDDLPDLFARAVSFTAEQNDSGDREKVGKACCCVS